MTPLDGKFPSIDGDRVILRSGYAIEADFPDAFIDKLRALTVNDNKAVPLDRGQTRS